MLNPYTSIGTSKVFAAQNLHPIEAESPQAEERGRGLAANSGTTVQF
jgi:hypothetical protein